MKILFIASGAGFCKESVDLLHLLSYLDRQKFIPLVAFYYYNNGNATKKIRGLGIPVLILNKNCEPTNYISSKFLLRRTESRWLHEIKIILLFFLRLITTEIPQLWRLLRILKKEEINVIVLNNDVYYHLVGALAAKITGIPCICKYARDSGKGRRIRRLLTLCIDLFIAEEEFYTGKLEAALNKYPFPLSGTAILEKG